jgi:3-deoxy-D-manno-octulosonate 8-phosphate phosphatase KdsC-like HAD superfamily phosphatase
VLQKYNAPTNLIIHAGEFEFKNGVPTGKIIGQLTAFDKEKVMAQLIKQHQNTNGYSIYVGNDFPDILAMLKADIGIAINYTPLFIRFVHALGIATQSVSDWRGACSNQEYLIYTAQAWNEIEEMMFGDLERN